METGFSGIQEVEPKLNEACYFMPGALNQRRGSEAAAELLTERFGPENVTIINSILTTESPTPPAETRFDSLSDQLLDDLKTKDKVVVIAHSLGVTEFNLVWQEVLKKTDKEFLEKNTQKLNLLLISPAEAFAENQQLTLLKRIASLFVRQSNAPLSWIPNETVGLESLIVQPIQGYQGSQKELQSMLRTAMPDLSHTGSEDEGDEVLSAPFNHKYDLQLKDKDAQLLEQIDLRLKEVISRFNANDRTAVKELRLLIKSRGSLLRPYVTKAYAGEYFEERQQVGSLVEALKTSLIAWALTLGKTIKQMSSGQALDTVLSLRRGMAKIQFYIPEYDTIVRPEEIRTELRRRYILNNLSQAEAFKLAEEDLLQLLSIKIGAGHTHASYVLQPGILVQLLDMMR